MSTYSKGTKPHILHIGPINCSTLYTQINCVTLASMQVCHSNSVEKDPATFDNATVMINYKINAINHYITACIC